LLAGGQEARVMRVKGVKKKEKKKKEKKKKEKSSNLVTFWRIWAPFWGGETWRVLKAAGFIFLTTCRRITPVLRAVMRSGVRSAFINPDILKEEEVSTKR